MIRDFPLPDLGEGLTESELVAWRVSVGDRVELNQIIADVETAKAVVELPSPYAGVITALHAAEGETIDVGAPLFSCDTGEPDAASPTPATGAASPAPAAPAAPASSSAGADVVAEAAPGPNLVGYGAAAETGPKRRARRSALVADLVPAVPESTADATAAEAAPAPAASARTERPRSTPPVRKLARDLGLDLEAIDGSGERGLITRDDVERAASALAMPVPDDVSSLVAGAPVAAGAAPAETRIPIKGVRKHTAAAMVRSAFTAPHVTEFLTVDVTATMELLRGLRDDRAFAGRKVTPLTVVAKAVCIAARRTPEVNSRWDEEAQEIVRFGGVNLGIAAATERGLVVPNVKGAERMTLIELADAIAALAETARAGRTSPADLSGGTISITNIGVFGIDAGTPILNPGEAAILAMGAVRRQPWEHRGEIALREVMTLSLSFDHRLVDGAQGSRFLADVGAILREPGVALTMV
ncbi:dihydrolipoamide acetyltransferase family protein [Agromyces cerinus]|uniref:Dihydrolipoamide acetyltransferase component of pyruvate dehydrogenase complex n=1 Tax=Agromyces cerinus subsp. cerinus TaxID=232089 RepID=A0A1N6H8U0_9MICO|nr:dihydrolipoamide acetyltransferase family protein [Agromyces cerinus]SIO16248.1 pyruvate dehydrogenase E2 component (dihydrolipoamide acetyltransferase) [Agromyces cerinus subsp. cerinus]